MKVKDQLAHHVAVRERLANVAVSVIVDNLALQDRLKENTMRAEDLLNDQQIQERQERREQEIKQLAKDLDIEDKPKLAAYLYGLSQGLGRLDRDTMPHRIIG